eukprot:5560896-Lingulodinium_polyedra.AAC.1
MELALCLRHPLPRSDLCPFCCCRLGHACGVRPRRQDRCLVPVVDLRRFGSVLGRAWRPEMPTHGSGVRLH